MGPGHTQKVTIPQKPIQGRQQSISPLQQQQLQGGGAGAAGVAVQQPVLDQNSTKQLTLTVLQRIDPAVEEMLTTAGHVTLYEFDVGSSSWSRKDVEGSLFVVKRKEQPRFQFLVLNRRSQENLVEDLLGEFEYELQVPYLLYRNAAQEVNGIWFYNQRECEEVAKLFNRILNAFSKHTPKGSIFNNQSRKFEELEAVPSASVVEGPLEPSSAEAASAAVAAVVPDAPPIAHSSLVLPITITSSTPVAALPLLPPPSSTSFSPTPPLPAPASTFHPSSTTLLKPSFFMPAPSTSPTPPLPPLSHPTPPPSSLHPSHGAPFLQPFPPPTPPPSLAPSPLFPPPTEPSVTLTREGVRSAMYRLLQNDAFVDMIFQEMLKLQKP